MNLKSVLGIGLALGLSATNVNAQKANVVTAYNYNKAFERDKECSDLEKGIVAIEEAVKDEKTGSWAKTWYYGGNLYFNAALNKDEECRAKFDNAIDKTMEFYLNALKYNIEDEGSNQLDLENAEDQQKFTLLCRAGTEGFEPQGVGERDAIMTLSRYTLLNGTSKLTNAIRFFHEIKFLSLSLSIHFPLVFRSLGMQT